MLQSLHMVKMEDEKKEVEEDVEEDVGEDVGEDVESDLEDAVEELKKALKYLIIIKKDEEGFNSDVKSRFKKVKRSMSLEKTMKVLEVRSDSFVHLELHLSSQMIKEQQQMMEVIDSALREVNQPRTLVVLALERVLEAEGADQGWPDRRQERAREDLAKLRRAYDVIEARQGK